MARLLCWLFGHVGDWKHSETTFRSWNDGKYYTTDNRWCECSRCGMKLTTPSIVVRNGPTQ